MASLNADERLVKETVSTVLASPGFRTLFEVGILPTLNEWRRTLILSENLDEPKRRGLVAAHAALTKGVEDIYAKCGVDVPHWLQQELNIFDVD